MSEPFNNELTTAPEKEDPKHITLSVYMGLKGKEEKTFKVSGREYADLYNSLIPAEGLTREQTNKILTGWVGRFLPYSREYAGRKTTSHKIDSYSSFGSLVEALNNNEIDGVICGNSAAVLLGLTTKGEGEGRGYHLIEFPPTNKEPGHAVVYDYQTKKYLDPQAGVCTLEKLREKYPGVDINEDHMVVLIPGPKRSKRIVAATGEIDKV